MRKIFSFFCLLIIMLAAPGCVREALETPEGPTMTITATVTDEPLTKAGFSVPASGEGLHLAWQAGDCIRVISGSNSAVYNIQDGFTDHVATFSGPEVPGSVFDVIAPGTYESVDDAEAGNLTLTQNGNGSTAHLVFTAKLGNVAKADLPNIVFSDDWAGKHSGTSFKRGGIVKFTLTLPPAVNAPKKVTMTGIGNDVSVNLTGISLTSEHVLTAYAQSGWDDVSIVPGTTFTVSVLNGDGSSYAATKTITAAKVLKAGAQNLITVNSGFTEQYFAGGDGTKGNPYLIASAKQLDNMHVDGILKHEEKVYFRLIDNIDMSAIDWVPLNQDSPYDMPVNFDGNGKTINKLTITTSTDKYKQIGLFGVLYGEVYNLKITNAKVTNTYGLPTGILCGYCGYNGKKSHVYNVHINGQVDYSSSLSGANGNGPAAGFAGRVHTCVIESCSADVVINSTKAFAGGIFGIDWSNGSVIRNCWTSGSVTSNGQRTGGIAGSLIKEGTSIINCFSTASVIAPRGIGGIVGYANMDSGSGKGYTDNKPDYVIKGCIAWQEQLRTNTYNGATSTNNFWSSGAIVSGTSTHNYLSNCWRRANLDFRDYSGEFTLYDQEDASPSTPLVVVNPKPATFLNYYPYHGKAAGAGESLSDVARRIGWSETVWDFSGATPVLTGALEPTPTSGNNDIPNVATTSRAFPADGSTTNGLTWEVKKVRNGIYYYNAHGIPTDSWWASGGSDASDQYQEIFVVDVDLSNTNYDVKVVVANPATTTSEVFRQTGAVAAINGGYEKASIAVKGNMFLDTSTEEYTNYPNGYAYSYMPKNTISDTGIANWKSEGTFYSNGHQNVRIAFDAYAGGATGKTNTSGTTLKSVEEMRNYYMFNTDNEAGFISSAPILDANYVRFGQTFRSRAAEGTEGESPRVHQGSAYSRTAVGIAYPNGDENEPHLLLIVNDGKYKKSTTRGYGINAYQLERVIANFFGPKYLLNLDGGGSSTMCVEGKGDPDTHVVNYPSDNYTGKYTDPDTGDKVSGKIDHAGERARDTFIVIVPAE